MKFFKFIILLLVFSSSLFSRSDAIIVGVGNYKYDVQSLKGVRYDMRNIKEVLKELKVTNIYSELYNKTATLNNLRSSLNRYIHDKKLNKIGNLFIFYYSGHGVQVDDDDNNDREKDHKDEAFALYDIKMYFDKKREQNVITGGLLLDDEFYSLLRQIKSKKILILDKCHSDSSERAVLSYKKSFVGKYRLSSKFSNTITDIFKNAEQNSLKNNIVLSASGSDEIAEDSHEGGLFTLSLRDAIVYHKAQKNGNLSVRGLQNFCDRNIYLLASDIRKRSKGAWQPKGAFSPTFRPNRILSQSLASLFNTKLSTSYKVKKRKEESLLENTLDSVSSKKALEIYIRKNSYVDKHRISFEVTPKRRGYLNIFIAYQDSYRVFIKNKLIQRGINYTYPEDFYKSERLIAEKSHGKTKIYAILSKKRIKLKKYLNASKSKNLNITNYFRKELIPSQVFREKKKKKQLNEEREIVEIEANILGISKVEFNVTR